MKNLFFVLSLGIIMKILDEIYDSKILLEYKHLLEVLCIILLIYVYTNNIHTSFIFSLFVVLYGVPAFFYYNEIVNDSAWIITICISICVLIYHFLNYKIFINNLSINDMKSFGYILLPTILSVIIFCYSEHIYTPDERSQNKLLHRIAILIGCLFLFSVLNFTQFNKNFLYDSDVFINCSNSLMIISIGYVFTSILFLSMFSFVY